MRCTWSVRLAFGTLSAVMLTGMPCRAQERTGFDTYGAAHQLLKVAYPSLAQQGLVVTLKGDEGVRLDAFASPLMHFLVAIVKSPDSEYASRPRTEILSGWIDFDFGGRLTKWIPGDSEFLNSATRRQLEERIARSPDSDVARIVLAANLKFGPDAAEQILTLVRPIVERLESLIGKASIIETRFFTRGTVGWEVKIQSQSSVGPLFYRLAFEPFEGRLVAINRDAK
jgi:hypothetical protein